MSLPTELDFGRLQVCGRNEELKQLRQALARCGGGNIGDDSSVTTSSSSCEAILIEGASGTGKSRLVDAFQESIISSHHQHHHHQQQNVVFFCRGKYDQDASADEPFQAIEECMDSLLNQMLAADESSSSSSLCMNWKTLVCQGMSRTEIKLLVNISPVIHDMLDTTGSSGGGGGGGEGEEDSISTTGSSKIDIRSSWSFDRLRLDIRSFFRIVCQHATIVFVQDDLQWIDEASLKIIKTFVFDKQAKNLLFVGTHREELETNHIINSQFKSKTNLKQHGNNSMVTVLKLSNLSLPAVTNVISNLTRREECDCQELAKVLLRRTGGNAFFLVQFLRLLHEKGLVHYSIATYQWEWNVDRVVLETEIADNVLDIVSLKIQQLDEPLQMALKSAACLGSSRFDSYILFQTMSALHPGTGIKPSEQPCLLVGLHHKVGAVMDDAGMEGLAAILDKVVEEGLLEKLGAPGKYKFAHDRIRESVCALLPQGENRASLHLEIGRKLRHLSTCSMISGDETRGNDRLVLMSAHHLNLGSKVGVCDADERNDLIELNFTAAELAFERSCFIPASNYLKAALELIDEKDRWTQVHYETSLKICTFLAHILFCCGNLAEGEALAQDIIHHARDLVDQLGAYRSLVNCQAHGGRSAEAIQTVVTVLKRLGFHVPNHLLLIPMVVVSFFRIKRRLRRMSDSDLLNLPLANEHDVKVMDFVILLGEVSMTAGDSDMGAWASVSLAKLNLERGSSPYTALALSVNGFLFGIVGDYETASKYGRLTMQIVNDKEEYNIYTAKAILICNFFLRHLKKPLWECLDSVLRAKQIIFDAGAVEYMFMPVVFYSNIYYHCGLCLEPLDRELSKLTEAMADYGQRHALNLVECHVQFIQNLMGKSDNPLVLTGEIMNQDESLKLYTESKHERALQSLYIYRMCLGYYFDDLDLAMKMSSKLFAPIKEGPTPVLAPRFLFQGLIAFALALSTNQRLIYARQGRSFLNRLKKMVRKGCINVHHMMLLLQAEEMALHGERDKVQEAFDEAIRAAGKLGLMHNQALGNERAGVFFLRKGDPSWSSTYFSRAWMLYVEWGAIAKANHLETKYGALVDKSKLYSSSLGTGIKAKAMFGSYARDPDT